MPRRTAAAVAADKRLILEILDDADEPLSRSDLRVAIQERTGSAPAFNTVRARLDELEREGLVLTMDSAARPVRFTRIDRNGAARDARPHEEDPQRDRLTSDARGIPLSPEGRRLRKELRRPRAARRLVGYDGDFLDQYVPGQSWYLDSVTRVQLRQLGRTAAEGQPAGTYARDIMQALVIDLSWGSSRLEGLRYSRIDTEELLSGGVAPAGASDRDRQLILNHKAAIEFLVEEAGEIGFNRYTILNLHALLAENLLDDRTEEGALRRRPVVIGSSVYTPTAIPQVIEERFDTILAKAAAIPDPIEQAFFVMVQMPYLQPFIDGNKRTSRLAANIPLIRANLCPLSFVEVSEDTYTEGVLGVYERRDVALLRDVFAWAYARSCAQFQVLRESMGDPDPIRLNYRQPIRTIVAECVRGLVWPTVHSLATLVEQLGVPEVHRTAVVDEVFRDLRSLRPEMLARYGLRIREFEDWSQRLRAIRRD